MALLYLSTADRAEVWKPLFAAAGEEMIVGEAAVADPAAITHIVCWQPPQDLRRYPNLRIVISTGAGVDQMPVMPDGVRLVRMLAPGIEEMVRNWVVMATLMLHRGMPAYIDQQRAASWAAHPVPLAGGARVGIMGLGRIGLRAAETLRAMGFDVAGWSRSGRAVDGIEAFGAGAMETFLARSDILICLLPLTAETRGLMDAAFFAKLPRGAMLVHAGRGAQLDMAALKGALDTGQLASAMLDVTNPEPLPADHWAWADPRLVITPHVAANTDAREGAAHVLEVLRASRSGAPIPGLVDQARGY